MRSSERPNLEALKGRARTAAEADDLARREQEVIDRGDTCRCALTAVTPDGDETIMDVCLDTGSEADCVSTKLATKLFSMGCSWGASGGRIQLANNTEVVPDGELRLLLTANRKLVPADGTQLKIPRPVSFATDAEIIADLTSELIIGWPTLRRTGLLAVAFGLESYEDDVEEDANEIDDLWPEEPPEEIVLPTIVDAHTEMGQAVRNLVWEFKHLFGPPPAGGSKLPPMDVQLKRGPDGSEMQPKRMAPRPVSPWVRDLIKADTELRLSKGWCRLPEVGEVIKYASPIVAAKQPQKGPNVRRICVDLKQVNKCAEETRHPVKNQKETMQRLAGSNLFDNLDLYKGYNQLKLTKRAGLLMAASTPDGIVIPVTAPFGFHGLPAHFQYLMSKHVFEGIEGRGLETFIDDCNVHHNMKKDTISQRIARLREVFERADKWDLRFNGKKSTLNATQCQFLGHKVDGEGIQHLESRVQGLLDMKPPYDVKSLRQFTGLLNYFGEHLGADLATVTRPLHKLTQKKQQWQWGPEQEWAFEECKRRVAANPKLFFLDYDKPIFIRCDASKVGAGAQLFQVVKGREQAVAFISKAFSATEQNWSTLEQELYAAVWAVKRWRQLLEGHRFTIQTDHRNILQLHKSEVPKVIRWRLALQQFDYDIIHVEGASARHAVADALSRLHGPPPRKLKRISLNAITRSHTKEVDLSAAGPTDLAASLGQAGEPSEPISTEIGAGSPGNGTLGNPAQAGTEKGSAAAEDSGKLTKIKRKGRQAQFRKEVRSKKNLENATPLDPKIKEIIATEHNNIRGHWGIARTHQHLMAAYQKKLIAVQPTRLQVEQFILNCPLCQKLVTKLRPPPVERGSLMTTKPMDEVSIDVIGPLPPDPDGNKFIIVVVDNFSKFLFAEPRPDTTAESAASFLHKLGGMVGWPRALRYDNCSQFDNHLIRCLTDLVNVERHPSVPFNPESNGVIERAIKEIVRHLQYIVNDRRIKESWSNALPIVLRMLNATKHGSIGLSPAEILLPGLDLNEGLYPKEAQAIRSSLEEIPDFQRRKEVQTYINHLQDMQRQAITAANAYFRQNQQVVAQRVEDTKDTKDSKELPTKRQFAVGDWVCSPWRGGKPHKLAVRYRGPYQVTKRLTGTTYEIRDPADDALYSRHVNELFRYRLGDDEDPIDTIAIDEHESIVESIVDWHRPEDSNSLKDYDFRVHFKNTSPADDVWLPYSECTRKRGLKAFWQFVAANPQLRIPLRH